jgi:hypothetical protein
MKKYFLLVLVLICAQSFSQTVYVKLKKPLEQSLPLVQKVDQEFAVNFVKEEKISALLNAPVYKVHHALTTTQAKQLHQLLSKDDHVVYSTLELAPPPPPNDIPPTTDDFTVQQDYLKSDPGVDAAYGWSQGADGSNVTIHLIEYGLNVNHEEFVGRSAYVEEGMTIATGAADLGYTEHGTATAGVVFGHDGDYGIKGIAYNANSLTLYPEWQEGQSPSRVQAVSNAVSESVAGDIIVYEMQTSGADGAYVVAEYNQLIWDLTQAATTRGAIVVAAAGNGGANLDSEDYEDYMARGDSGAIIVGASQPTIEHPSYGYSTHGSRVNINAWGSDVFTSGYGWIQVGGDFDQNYTPNFGGTSSATAISGGFVAALQSYYYQISNGEYLNASQMRDVLVESGITPSDAATRPIGVFINMKNAIERLNLLSNDDESFGDDLILYPNPTDGLVYIKNDKLTSGQMDVFDSLGKHLLSQSITEEDTKLDFTSFSPGVYFVKIVSGSKSGIKRIIRN